MISKKEKQKPQQKTKHPPVATNAPYHNIVSATSKRPQQQHNNNNKPLQNQTAPSKSKFDKNKNATPFIYRLPDDVLVYLLVKCPIIDFDTLCALLYTSKKLRYIGCQVLRYYLLPYIRLATVIDQEGHGKWTCIYAFDVLNEATLHASFIPIRHRGQRYRYDPSTNAPTLRYILATMDNDRRSSSITHQPIINSASNNSNNNNNNNVHYQHHNCQSPRRYRHDGISTTIKSSNIASWMIDQEHPQKHRIINNPNCRLDVKQYSSKKVVQGTISNSITTMIPCAMHQEQVIWRLTYIVNHTRQEEEPPSALPICHDSHLSSLSHICLPQHNSNINRVPVQQQQQKLHAADYNTNVRYMIPICLTTNITSLSSGFMVHHKKSKSVSSCGSRFVQYGTTWIKDKWRKWCLR